MISLIRRCGLHAVLAGAAAVVAGIACAAPGGAPLYLTLEQAHALAIANNPDLRKAGADHPPCTVTADFAVKLLRPTPTAGPVTLRARVVESTDDRALVESSLETGGKTTATCRGTFVAVKPGHPAYHRW